MAGIPPLAGFFVKYFVLIEAFLAGLTLQVINGLATSLISAFYYLRIIKTAMFESTIGAVPITQYISLNRLFFLFGLEGGL
jgi:NADH-quinone oxidoreductase subunit N